MKRFKLGKKGYRILSDEEVRELIDLRNLGDSLRYAEMWSLFGADRDFVEENKEYYEKRMEETDKKCMEWYERFLDILY